jgi:NAD-dependent deacetylase
MNIAVFTGAGISAESGLETFRSGSEALWNNHTIDDVATPEGWEKNASLVTDFYNARRMQLNGVYPNDAHEALVELEDKFNVTIITQNIDDLHERAGSTKVLKLHGDLRKVKSELDPTEIYNWNYNPVDIKLDFGKEGGRLRPDVVWFGEMPNQDTVIEAGLAIAECDILLIIGTSLQITYTIPMLKQAPNEIYYIDPTPKYYLEDYVDSGEICPIDYVRKNAVEGVRMVVDNIMSNETYQEQYS